MSTEAAYRSRPIKRARRAKADIEAIKAAIYDVVSEAPPVTCRQAFYQLTVRGVVQKTEAENKHTVCRLLGTMRRAGELPFEWIADNTRWMRKPRTFSTLENCLELTAQTYRRALWDDQPAYVEIWIEKDALAGVLIEETAKYDVPLMVSKGFSSMSYLYEAAKQIEAVGKPAYLYYLGDHDPSGVHIDRAIERDLRTYAPDAEIHFKRVAVTVDQISKWQLPTRPTKKTDSRSKGFDGDSVELDAIPPQQLRDLVRGLIEQHIDEDILDRTRRIEVQERHTLELMIDGMGDAA